MVTYEEWLAGLERIRATFAAGGGEMTLKELAARCFPDVDRLEQAADEGSNRDWLDSCFFWDYQVGIDAAETLNEGPLAEPNMTTEDLSHDEAAARFACLIALTRPGTDGRDYAVRVRMTDDGPLWGFSKPVSPP
jgi:hypothetical protein